jgi:flagellar hook protein FlgE
MIRSLFTAIGGLKAHQTMMDVTANNIANVNTVGYKTQRATFASMLSQNVKGSSAPQPGGAGGTDPTQVGLGVALQGVQSVMTQGSLQTTGQWNDMAIQGDGYFIVSASKPTGGAPTDTEFTRAGNFTTDVNGDLVTQSGQYVLGSSVASAGPPPTFNADLGSINIPVTAEAVQVGNDGVVSYTDSSGVQQTAGQIQTAKFTNPGGLQHLSDNQYGVSTDSGAFDPTNQNNGATPTVGTASWGAPGLNGRGSISPGTLEMSNVDLAQEFTSMITAERGFQANARTITTSDSMLEELVNLKRS